MSQHGKIQKLLREHGIELTRRLGQHFLVDDRALATIARQVGADATSDVVEIGAGIGNLTIHLLQKGARVTALEIDRRFEPIHAERLLKNKEFAGRIRVLYEDALEYDYRGAGEQAARDARRFLIAGNIPYQITSPLIMGILESQAPFESMVLMMQREVAERLASAPGSRKNGTITIKAQYFCTIEPLLDVPASAFLPPPEVESKVLRFRRRPQPLDEARRARFFQLVDASFAQRRKQLSNSIAARGIGYSKPRVDEALERLGLPAKPRAEDLGLKDFLALFEQLEASGGPEPQE